MRIFRRIRHLGTGISINTSFLMYCSNLAILIVPTMIVETHSATESSTITAYRGVTSPKAEVTPLPMRATSPTAGPTNSLFEFGTNSPDMLPTRLGFLDRSCPANPFIACQRRNILPGQKSFPIRIESHPQIGWHFMKFFSC